MSYAMLVGGVLKVPEAKLADYLALEVDPTRRTGWVGALKGRGEASGPVEDYLEALPGRLITAAGSWLEVRLAPSGEVGVHGVLAEDDFLDHAAALADAFRVGADVGGGGALFFLEEQVPFHTQEPELCYAVRVQPGRSKVEHVPEAEQASVIGSELFGPVLRRIEDALGRVTPWKPARAAMPVKPKKAKKAKAPTRKRAVKKVARRKKARASRRRG